MNAQERVARMRRYARRGRPVATPRLVSLAAAYAELEEKMGRVSGPADLPVGGQVMVSRFPEWGVYPQR